MQGYYLPGAERDFRDADFAYSLPALLPRRRRRGDDTATGRSSVARHHGRLVPAHTTTVPRVD